MSGTSLDGLDLALCKFNGTNAIEWQMLHGITYPYDETWVEELSHAHHLEGLKLQVFHHYYGKYIGVCLSNYLASPEVKSIIKEQLDAGEKELIISSHGHTVFHDPELGITFQAGHGADIMAITQIPVVSDFRVQDIALGGQGAPLVPIGDVLLFSEYAACLNLGGFANVSMEKEGKRIAWDICPLNIVLNQWARCLGDTMDRDGKYSRAGKMIFDQYSKWEGLDYYIKEAPKSLGREWVESVFLEGIYEEILLPADLMHTAVKHFAKEIAKNLPNEGKVLITGGGAFNNFLLECLKEQVTCELVIPKSDLIHFKEAIIFALLGYLRWNNTINIMSSVTGASQNHCSGQIFLP